MTVVSESLHQDHRDCLPGFCVFPPGDPLAEHHGPSWRPPHLSPLCLEEDHGFCEDEGCECSCHAEGDD